ncbi:MULTISPECIES: hypothetical protein [Trichocoleus]|uniref:Superfamily II DNA and RNA helicase n=1 Tax=Trichocoleus desertorum GB2-A4 TaxID=2933944 RepID=A0ABV0J4R2_9CYAN|nr:hypothetical protein [Trichocoleus sp. FACHB-46]
MNTVIHPPMFRRFVILVTAVALCWTTLACGETPSVQSPPPSVSASTAPTRIPSGQYPVQQATYNDANGEYSLVLLNTQPGVPAVFRTPDLQMARLTEAEVSSKQQNYLKVDGGKASLHVAEDFKIEYVHNVVENQTDPQTGRQETVVVRQQSSFWTPFAGALAGQVVGNLLFTPRYYVPPVYQPGGLRGFGGYGDTYGQAVNSYQSRYQTPPPAVRNRQTLRTTGRLRTPTSGQPSTVRRPSTSGNRSTGSGYGSSTLRQSGRSQPRVNRGSGGFGSSRSTGVRRSRSGSRRR